MTTSTTWPTSKNLPALKRITGWHIAWAAYALVMVNVCAIGANPAKNDFHAFYLSGVTATTGQVFVIPDRPDLNPPIFGYLMVPFTWLPVHAAFFAWTTLGLMALVASLRIIARHAHITTTGWIWIVGAVGATMPALLVWQEGQITWFLLFLVTKAWTADKPHIAGLWLAPVVMLKPPLALMALVLPVRIWSVTAAVSIGGTALAVALTGLEPWLRWLGKSQAVQWLDWPANASLWGIAARLQSGTVWGMSLAELAPVTVAPVIIVAVVIGFLSLRASGDRKWLAGVLFATLASPLGWIYYLPIALGPLVKSWDSRLIAFVVLMTIPMQLMGAIGRQSPLGAAILGSVYGLGVLWAWFVTVKK